jgi:hypothetical protein
MKYPVTRFKSLEVCLKELEPFIRNGEHLRTGKPFKQFGGLRSRELLANWLLCVAVNHAIQKDRFTFTSDPLGGDGVVCDNATEETYLTEHVLVPPVRGGEPGDAEKRILEAICHKQDKGGTAYASGKTLVVFLEAAAGDWHPNKVARQVPEEIDFEAVWVVGLQGVEDGEYVYGVTRLDLSRGNVPVWHVRIAKDFESWKVEPLQ